jgi:hypothetical protein
MDPGYGTPNSFRPCLQLTSSTLLLSNRPPHAHIVSSSPHSIHPFSLAVISFALDTLCLCVLFLSVRCAVWRGRKRLQSDSIETDGEAQSSLKASQVWSVLSNLHALSSFSNRTYEIATRRIFQRFLRHNQLAGFSSLHLCVQIHFLQRRLGRRRG